MKTIMMVTFFVTLIMITYKQVKANTGWHAGS
jgi:hypothetical protein